jgi:hypothetical protein
MEHTCNRRKGFRVISIWPTAGRSYHASTVRAVSADVKSYQQHHNPYHAGPARLACVAHYFLNSFSKIAPSKGSHVFEFT